MGSEVSTLEGTIIEKGNSMGELRWLDTKELAYPVQDALDDIAKGKLKPSRQFEVYATLAKDNVG